MEQRELGVKIEQEVRQQLGARVVVGETDEMLMLSGVVGSKHEREQAEHIARSLAGTRRVESYLEVEGTVPDGQEGFATAERDIDGSSEFTSQNEVVSDIEPDFTSQELDTSTTRAANDSVVDDLDEDEEDADGVYFPPTDPVFSANDQGEIEVLNGFSASSEDDRTLEYSDEDETLGDEALVDAINEELLRDAATTDLRISVEVQDGVAYLHGSVPRLEDAENAEEVASRVPGVREVVEELDIADI